MLTLAKFCRWVFQKAAAAALILVLGIAACGVWLYLKDNADFEEWRRDRMREITGERAKLQSALQDVSRQQAETAAALERDESRLHAADRIIAELQQLDSTWTRLFGSRERREQQERNRARLADVTRQRAALADAIAREQQTYTHLGWTRDGLEIALGKQDAKVQRFEAQRSKVFGYVERVWNYPVGRGVLRLPIKGWVAVVLGLYFFGPTLGKGALFFILAPWVARGRPVRLSVAADALPQVGESRVATEVDLAPGERLWVREKFLQASDEGLNRRTRAVLDWRIPFTCLAAGLIEMIEMKNGPLTPATGASGARFRVTLSNQADPHSELAVVTLVAGSSLVLRPSFLAGVVVADTQRLQIRRHWQLFRWQSWVTLQFRFFEFIGPGRLLVSGSRGIRVENLADREGPALPARRTNQDATVGFTPNLDYRPVRAETFWSYYRGMNPLFDDLFAGRGLFLCQQVATEGDAKRARKFWASVWSGVMKVFGL